MLHLYTVILLYKSMNMKIYMITMATHWLLNACNEWWNVCTCNISAVDKKNIGTCNDAIKQLIEINEAYILSGENSKAYEVDTKTIINIGW